MSRFLLRMNPQILKCCQVAKVPKWNMIHNINKDSKATVIYDESNKSLNISLRYTDEEYKIDKILNFHRGSSEKCSYVTSKISEKVSLYINRKVQRKLKSSSNVPVSVQANIMSIVDGKIIDDEEMECCETFVNSAEYYLKIGKNSYIFDVNPPHIVKLELPKKIIFAGYIVYPNIEGINYESNDTLLKWFRTKDKFDSYDSVKKHNLKKSEWEEIGQGFKLHTSNDDLSRLLKVVGTPCKGELQGPTTEAISSVLISKGPGCCPFEMRHIATTQVLPKDCLRVVSYNLLADFYADSDFSRTTLFPTCPPYALDIEYRKQLFIKEILGYNADLICLQEVDCKIYSQDLKPVFSHYGLDGVFNAKSLTAEGLATFYRKDKLELKESIDYLLSHELTTNPLLVELLEKVNLNQCLYEAFAKQKTILQVNVLERRDSPSHVLVAGACHLYSDPKSNHIRLLQAVISLALLRRIVDLQKAKDSTNEVSLILCGDFNSTPEDTVFRLMTKQNVDEDDKDWSSKAGEEVKGVSFSHDFDLGSACGTPMYTNFTVGFKGCLDYIYYQTDKLALDQVIPFPTQEDLTEHTALPSLTFPSDHIALVADFKWIK